MARRNQHRPEFHMDIGLEAHPNIRLEVYSVGQSTMLNRVNGDGHAHSSTRLSSEEVRTLHWILGHRLQQLYTKPEPGFDPTKPARTISGIEMVLVPTACPDIYAGHQKRAKYRESDYPGLTPAVFYDAKGRGYSAFDFSRAAAWDVENIPEPVQPDNFVMGEYSPTTTWVHI